MTEQEQSDGTTGNQSDFYSRQRSSEAFERAKTVMPGGVNSPARSFDAVEGPPPFIEEAKGATLQDTDGNEYLDFVCSWGPMIFGHGPNDVMGPVIEQVKDGMSFGAPTRKETEMAELVTEMVPSIDVVRMVNSGTEATMSALRLTRGATDRDYIVKFEGCYHGHGDSLLVEAGSGGATLGQPDSAGVPEDLARLTLTVPFNDTEAVESVFEEFGDRIAGVILEPVAGNMGLIQPEEDFLTRLREITSQHGSLLIFDEVMTGFRVAEGGVQSVYNIEPDITTLGKIIGGGMPVGAYGGREEVMREVAPDGPVYQAGTLSGNPVAMEAGLETLKKLRREKPYDDFEKALDRIESAFREGADEAGVPLQFHRMGGMFSYYFTDEEVTDYDSASSSDDDLFAEFHRNLLENGLYFPPSYFESSFLSVPLIQEKPLEKGLRGIRNAFRSLES
jgi:glutamate-1-semialdehyde 2,1-aminomutase